MPKGLIYDNSSLYADWDDIDRSEKQRQCIAPTQSGARCRMTVKADEFNEANRLREKAESLVPGPERDELLEQYALLRCCNRFHREKLGGATKCRGELVERYSSVLSQGTQISKPELPQRQSQRLQTKEARSNPPVCSAGSSTTTPESTTEKNIVPYKTTTNDTVRGSILSTAKAPSSGEVYCFTDPSCPGVVKIGYTGKTAEQRVHEWRRCFPGAVLRYHVQFKFPRRMEKLMHVQMAERRRKQSRCSYCPVQHGELFEVPIDQAIGIMNDWAEVVEREPLYESDGSLTTAWKQRISKIEGDLTAKELLRVLDMEAAAATRNKTTQHETRKTQLPPSPLPDCKTVARIDTEESANRHPILRDNDIDEILPSLDDLIRLLLQKYTATVLPDTPRVDVPQLSRLIPVAA